MKVKKNDVQRVESYKKFEIFCDNNDLTLLTKVEEFGNTATNCNIGCNKCGHVRYSCFSNLKTALLRLGIINCKGCQRVAKLDNIRNLMQDEGCELLTEVFVDTHSKLDYVCSGGHVGKITEKAFKVGVRCAVCVGNNIKHTVEHVREVFVKEGYELLSTDYVGNKNPLKYKCPVGHFGKIAFKNFKHDKQRCSTCFGTPKHDIEFVRGKFKERGFELLSTEYPNNFTKLDYKCPVGHEHSVTYNAFDRGDGCPSCSTNGTYTTTLAKRNKKVWKKTPITLYKFDFEYEGKKYFKVGLTNSIKRRQRDFPFTPTNLKLVEMNLYDGCFAEEKWLGIYRQCFTTPDIIKRAFDGWTECFSYSGLK